jgi:hypothetical protein
MADILSDPNALRLMAVFARHIYVSAAISIRPPLKRERVSSIAVLWPSVMSGGVNFPYCRGRRLLSGEDQRGSRNGNGPLGLAGAGEA